MKRGLLLLAVTVGVVLWALAFRASAQVSRYIVEDGDGGTFTAGAYPERVRGQGVYTAVGFRCETNACTRTAPSGATEGVTISGVGSYVVTAALSTGTFSGTGPIELYAYLDDSGGGGPSAAWFYILGGDITPPSGKSSFVTMVNTISLRPGNYRIAFRPNAVATSAAAPTLTMSLRACQTATCAP